MMKYWSLIVGVTGALMVLVGFGFREKRGFRSPDSEYESPRTALRNASRIHNSNRQTQPPELGNSRKSEVTSLESSQTATAEISGEESLLPSTHLQRTASLHSELKRSLKVLKKNFITEHIDPQFRRLFTIEDFNSDQLDTYDFDRATLEREYIEKSFQFFTKHVAGIHSFFVLESQKPRLIVEVTIQPFIFTSDDGRPRVSTLSGHLGIHLGSSFFSSEFRTVRLNVDSSNDLWLVGPLIGCDAHLSSHFSAIAIEIPRSLESKLQAKVLLAKTSQWIALSGEAWEDSSDNEFPGHDQEKPNYCLEL